MRRLLLAGVVLFLFGCETKRVFPDIEPYYAGAKENYQIGVGDTLAVNVWRNTDLSVTVPVRPDGKVSVPLVGDVQAAGTTTEGLAQKLTAELANYVRTPQVTVIVQRAASAEFLSRVRITGAVRKPLSVAYRDGMTVMDLVLEGGGLSPFASGNNSKLYRTTKTGTKAYPIYLEDILERGDLRSNYRLSPSDTIAVPETRF